MFVRLIMAAGLACMLTVVVSAPGSSALTKSQLDEVVDMFTRYMTAAYTTGRMGLDCRRDRESVYADFLKKSGDIDVAEMMSSFSYAYCVLGRADTGQETARGRRIIEASRPLFYEIMR